MGIAVMDEFGVSSKKQNQILVLVCINFFLFMILFTGLGYVTWQSATLVNRLKDDLDKAEQTVAEMKNQLEHVDTNKIIDQMVASASVQLSESIKNVVQSSNLTEPIMQASEDLAATQEIIQEAVEKLDNVEIANQVSYQILKGLGDGFQSAAESRKPESSNIKD